MWLTPSNVVTPCRWADEAPAWLALNVVFNVAMVHSFWSLLSSNFLQFFQRKFYFTTSKNSREIVVSSLTCLVRETGVSRRGVNVSAVSGLWNFQAAQLTDEFEWLTTAFRGFMLPTFHGDLLSLYCAVWKLPSMRCPVDRMPDTLAVTFLIFTTVTKHPELNMQMFFSFFLFFFFKFHWVLLCHQYTR